MSTDSYLRTQILERSSSLNSLTVLRKLPYGKMLESLDY